jgi:hypothetical protein
MSTRDAERVALLIEARAERDSAIRLGDGNAARYAMTAIGLLSGSEHEPNPENERRMVCASVTCLQAARRLLWGAEDIKAKDVS